MSKAKPDSKKPMSKVDQVKHAQAFAKAMTSRLGQKATEESSDGKK